MIPQRGRNANYKATLAMSDGPGPPIKTGPDRDCPSPNPALALPSPPVASADTARRLPKDGADGARREPPSSQTKVGPAPPPEPQLRSQSSDPS